MASRKTQWRLCHLDVYSPIKLDVTQQQTRLVVIQPGLYSDPIECSLRSVDIENTPEYEASSYVWGRAIQRTPILVNGYPIAFTRNLEVAFQHLRHVEKECILWVDAICIYSHRI
jgi:hypothetical protein